MADAVGVSNLAISLMDAAERPCWRGRGLAGRLDQWNRSI
jgi:hypothetical protein